MVKGWTELKSLAPFSWDTRVDDHPPGEAAMRDFSDAFAYTSSAERPRRSTGQYAQTPTPLTKRQRTSASAGKEGRTASQKKVARPGQDKENRGTPSTAYISSRLGLASPALHTPSGASAHDPDGEAASKAVSLCNDAHTTSTPSGRMDFSHLRPCMVDKDHSTPISAEPSAEPALPVGPVSEQRHSSQLGPAHSCAQQSGAEADPLAKWQQSTDTNAGASPAHPMESHSDAAVQRDSSQAHACSIQMVRVSEATLPGAARVDIEGSCGADVPSAQRLVHTGATPLSMSPPRQLAPAGPVQDPASSPQCNEPSQPCHTATQGCPTPRDQLAEPSTTTLAASAEHSHHALEQTQRPVMPQLCVRLAGATIPALCHPPAVAASVPEAPAQRLPQPAQQQQQRRQQPLIAPVASAPAAAQWHSSPTVQPQTLQEGICGHVAPTHAQQMLPATALRQTIANSSDAKPAARMHAMADAVLPHSRGAPRGQAAEGAAQQGSRAGHSQRAAGSRSSRGGSYDRNLSGTRMSLRSRNPPADKTRRKVSNSSRNVGRVRSAFEVKAPAYATRSRSNALSESEPSQRKQASDHRSRRRHVAGSSTSSSRSHYANKVSNHQVRQAGFASRATSSDLEAAQALAELRHEDEVDDEDCVESGEEMAEEEEDWRGCSGGAGYDRGFRVPVPPLPLWLPAAGTASADHGSAKQCPPLFRSAPCSSTSQDWSTPALQVLPRHRQSAAAAAEAMLANPSPLSGLHKLALTICARKKGSATQPCAVLAGGAGAQGKENVTPAQQGQEGNASDVAHSPGIGHAPEAVQEQADLTKTQQGWDRYVAAQLRGAKGSACQAKLVSALEAELAQPGLGLLTRACLLLRLEDARAGLLYSQYHGILAACTA